MRALPLLGLAWLLSQGGAAHARPGDLDEPLRVTGFPFVHAHSTAGHTSRVARYGCSPTISEAGPEVAYVLDVPRAGDLVASVETAGGVVDVDVHIVASTRVESDGRLAACLGRGNTVAQVGVTGGTYYVVVDTYEAPGRAGGYTLRLDYQPHDDWYERPLARGVTLRTNRYMRLNQTVQFVSVLQIDPTQGAQVRPVIAERCTPLPVLAAATQAVAAVSGGLFDDETSCQSRSFLKEEGRVVTPAAMGVAPRSAFGIDASGRGLVRTVLEGGTFIEAVHAIGGLPRLLTSGAADIRAMEEGAPSGFADVWDARTFAGATMDGRIVFGSVDGRTSVSQGMSLPTLAAYALGLGLGLWDAVNLDGGQTSTVWVRGQPHDGILNYPARGRGNHLNARPLKSAWLVFGSALSRPPQWLTTPEAATVAAGSTYVYEGVAADPEGGGVSFAMEGAGAGLARVDDRGDSSVRFSYTPRNADVAASPLTLTFAARSGAPVARQTIALTVAPGPEPDAGADAGVEPDAGTSMDAGVEPDAGTSADAGAVGDAGSPRDAGAPGDGGTSIVDGGAGSGSSAGCAVVAMGADASPWVAALLLLLGAQSGARRRARARR